MKNYVKEKFKKEYEDAYSAGYRLAFLECRKMIESHLEQLIKEIDDDTIVGIEFNN
jgi:hypothetical protein